MESTPRYGRRSDPTAAPQCPRHPHVQSVSYCKRCNRPTCMTCTLPTEVGTICVECTSQKVTRVARPALGAPVTLTLIGLCALVHVVGIFTSVLAQYGGFFAPLALAEPWRALTTAFLHADVWHLAFNVMALYWTGQGLEPLMGRARFLALYLLSALGGSTFVLAWVLVDPMSAVSYTVGASGAVFGLFGAVFVLQKVMGLDTRSIVGLLALNFMYGFLVANVSWQGHLGGLLVGMLVTYVMVKLDRPTAGMTAKAQHIRTAAALFGVAVVLLAIQYGTFSVLSHSIPELFHM